LKTPRNIKYLRNPLIRHPKAFEPFDELMKSFEHSSKLSPPEPLGPPPLQIPVPPLPNLDFLPSTPAPKLRTEAQQAVTAKMIAANAAKKPRVKKPIRIPLLRKRVVKDDSLNSIVISILEDYILHQVNDVDEKEDERELLKLLPKYIVNLIKNRIKNIRKGAGKRIFRGSDFRINDGDYIFDEGDMILLRKIELAPLKPPSVKKLPALLPEVIHKPSPAPDTASELKNVLSRIEVVKDQDTPSDTHKSYTTTYETQEAYKPDPKRVSIKNYEDSQTDKLKARLTNLEQTLDSIRKKF
jgi:hypothetical protein